MAGRYDASNDVWRRRPQGGDPGGIRCRHRHAAKIQLRTQSEVQSQGRESENRRRRKGEEEEEVASNPRPASLHERFQQTNDLHKFSCKRGRRKNRTVVAVDVLLEKLTKDDGWLTLIGLFWLKEGENSLGSDSTDTVVLPKDKTALHLGSIWLTNGTLRFEAKKGVEVRWKDSLISKIDLQSDEGGKDPTILSIGTVNFYVIERGGKYAVRVKDKESETRKNFKGLECFPIDAKWRIEAKFEPYSPPETLNIPSMVGTIEKYPCPGALVFELDGKEHRLDAVIETGSENRLFITFGDATNGGETYNLGRQLYTALPDSNNKVILDFNRAYNWPCVFTVYATCPLIPKQNILPIRVED